MHFFEIKHQPEKAKSYLGSPALVRLIDGALLAAHDYFGPGSPLCTDGTCALTSVYRSEDNGATWNNINHIVNLRAATFLIRGNDVFVIGGDREFGAVVIRKSSDGGFSWTNAVDDKTGLLFPLPRDGKVHGYHGANQVFRHKGRIYRAFEDRTRDRPGFHDFRAAVISADENADLLDASSWIMSNSLLFDAENWIPDFDDFEEQSYGHYGWGWLEGQVQAAPDGRLFNVLRVASPLRKWAGHDCSDRDPVFSQERADACENSDHAALVEILDGGRTLRFNKLIDFPGGGIGRFRLQRDPETGLYLSLVNRSTDAARKFHYWRNVLSLSYSEDLIHWKLAGEILTDDSGLNEAQSRALTGFQYPDWIFDGDDILYLCRTSYRGSHGAHDANRITFHVLKNYRKLIDSSRGNS